MRIEHIFFKLENNLLRIKGGNMAKNSFLAEVTF